MGADIGSIDDVNKNCLDSFRAHWKCLENNNQQMWHCRLPEQILNTCVFESLGIKKEIPGSPANELPVHERPKQIFSYGSLSRRIPESKLDELKAKREATIKELQEKSQQLEKDVNEKYGVGEWEKLKNRPVEEIKEKLKDLGEKAKEKVTGN